MEIKEERTGIELKFYNLCQKIVEEQGLKLYDMEYLPGSGELRVFIMDEKTGSAVLDDCVKVDRAFDPYLEESWVPETLTLQVSSPGLFRKLKTLEHFKAAIGEEVNLQLKMQLGKMFEDAPKEIAGDKKVICLLEAVTEDKLSLKYNDFVFEVPFIDLKKATLETDINNVRG
jgi:ribosome maturation factor RimP